MASGLARHSGARQAEIASNIANANTPGFRAKDLTPFTETYRTVTGDAGMRHTRAKHVFADRTATFQPESIDRPSGMSPNGNTVSTEIEMVNAVNAQRAHNRAITIYQSAIGILRSSIKAQR